MRVLVADDDPVIRRILERALTSKGHEVVLASDGEAALRLALAKPLPELILLDWVMPRMSGIEVCRRLRAQDGPRRYVLMLTGRSMRRDFIEAIEAGVDDFLRKPFPPEELMARISMVERWLGPAKGKGDLPALLKQASQSEGGEVVVRSEGTLGRIYFHGGLVVWVHVEPVQDSFLGSVADRYGVPQEELSSVIEESKRTGRFFGDIVVEWGLLGRDELLAVLKQTFSQRLERLLLLPDPTSMFVPQLRDYLASQGLPLAELLPRRVLETVPKLRAAGNWRPLDTPPEPELPRVLGELARPALTSLASANGVHGIVLIDLDTGEELASAGTALPGEITWAASHLVRSIGESDEALDEIVATGGLSCYLARLLPSVRAVMLLRADRAVHLAPLRRELVALAQELDGSLDNATRKLTPARS